MGSNWYKATFHEWKCSMRATRGETNTTLLSSAFRQKCKPSPSSICVQVSLRQLWTRKSLAFIATRQRLKKNCCRPKFIDLSTHLLSFAIYYPTFPPKDLPSSFTYYPSSQSSALSGMYTCMRDRICESETVAYNLMSQLLLSSHYRSIGLSCNAT